MSERAQQWPELMFSPKNTLAFCKIDRPDDIWSWAIVTGYGGDAAQPSYDSVLMAFDETWEPFRPHVVKMLAALEEE